MREQMLREIEVNLNKKTIFDVRQIARALNVHSEFPQKPKIIEAILSYAKGETEPQPPSVRGAPPKSDMYDERLVLQIEQCRKVFKSEEERPESVLTVNSSERDVSGKISGVLEKLGDDWFVLTASGEVFVANSFLQRYPLKVGDKITGSAIRKNDALALMVIDEVNGFSPESAEKGRDFSSLTPVYPEKKIVLSRGNNDTACRIIDIFAPLAFGQRAFISAAPNCGKTTLIKKIANAISENEEVAVIVLLLNARPEEVTDFKRNINGAELFSATFDALVSYQTRVAEAAFSYAQRLIELGKSAVVLADGLFVTGGGNVKKFVGSALNADEGGSLTVICALPENVDDYDGYAATANNIIKLSSELAARRVYPAIDAVKCFAGREEFYLSEDELSAANALRRNYGAEEIVKIFKSTADNTEIIKKYKNG